MFKTANDFKTYIKTTLKSSGACSAPSQASIYQTYHSKKFHPVGTTYCPGNDGYPLECDGNVTWKYNSGTTDQNCKNLHKFCAFYLGFEDKKSTKTPVLFLHFEYDDNNIYNVGVELTKVDISSVFPWEWSDKSVINYIFNIF